MIELLGGTTLAGAAAPLAAAVELHALDRVAFGMWTAVVTEAQRWVPAALTRAVQWCAPLPHLPAIAHLARGGAPLPWMAGYAELRPLCAVSSQRSAAPLPGGLLAPLAPAWGRPQPEGLGSAWLAEWRRRLPVDAGRGPVFGQLSVLFAGLLRAVLGAEPHESVVLRDRLESGLLRHFRRHAQDPSAVFAWLGLSALDIRRLRGEFAWRIALPRARPVS
jgi:hypothetical protein